MTIALVLNHYLPDHVAGTEVYTSLLAQYLLRNNISVSVIIPNYGQQTNSTYTHNGITVHCYAEPSVIDRSLIMGFRQPEGLSTFIELISCLKPDIVHFQELAGSNGITLHHVEASKRLGFKVIFTTHVVKYSCKKGDLMLKNKTLCDGLIDINRCSDCIYSTKVKHSANRFFLKNAAHVFYTLNIDLSKLLGQLSTALSFPFLVEHHRQDLLKLANSCDRVVTLTNWYRSILISNKIPEHKLSIIPQTLPLFDLISKPYNSVSDLPVKVVFIGRISSFKGVDLLIKAIQRLPRENISVTFFGQETDKTYLDYCKNLCEGFSNIKWGGKLEPKKVVDTLQTFDILCLPSTINEMSPLVIQEAFAAGIPVIASDVYGNAEQIRHNKNGLLFEVNNLESLVFELQRLVMDPVLLDELKNHIQKPANFNDTGMRYISIYKEVLSK